MEAETLAYVGEQTSRIVAAFVSNPHSNVTNIGLPDFIAQIGAAVAKLYNPGEVAPATPEPAVPIKRSITADAIVCLDCGTKHTSIRRHLRTAHDLSPDAYRERWGLAPDYPMVTAAYSQRRSDLAKQHGLGRNK
jgi:predicted transcriptional regulator